MPTKRQEAKMGRLIAVLQAREGGYKQIISDLLKAQKWRFGERLSLVPKCHGVYAISEIGAPVGEYLHAGRTNNGRTGLYGRMSGHKSCSTSDDLLVKLKRRGRCQSIVEETNMIDKGKRPRDPNQLAKWVVDRSTGQIPEEPQKPEPPAVPRESLSAYMASIGRKGGQIGGKRRLKTMTKAQRQRVAAKAARTRWKQRKAQK